MQVGYRKRGQSGIEVSDWWPHVGECIDDIAVVRSMWTTDNDHGAQLQFHTGRHALEGYFPTIGSWVHYGLGSLNDNLPQFVVLGDAAGGLLRRHGDHGADYLGPEHAGVPLRVDPANPLPFARAGRDDVPRGAGGASSSLLGKLNRLAAVEYPDDAGHARADQVVRAGLPHADGRAGSRCSFETENEATRRLYGLDQDVDASRSASNCLGGPAAGRAGRAVRAGLPRRQRRAGGWDAHSDLKTATTQHCSQVDQPIAGAAQGPEAARHARRDAGGLGHRVRPHARRRRHADGRDHHPYGFSVWLAGGGIKGGVVHGATDELGFHAVENRHYVTDIHATVLHQLGLDPRKLEVPGRKRLDIDFGEPIRPILA